MLINLDLKLVVYSTSTNVRLNGIMEGTSVVKPQSLHCLRIEIIIFIVGTTPANNLISVLKASLQSIPAGAEFLDMSEQNSPVNL